MQFDIRTAALNDDVERRVGLAVSQFMANDLRARVSPWDGTRCNLLVAAAADAYGYQALALALRRGTPVIALGEPAGDLDVEPLSADSTVASLGNAMRARLQGAAQGSAPAHSSPAPLPDEAQPIVSRLAVPPLRGKAVDLRSNSRLLMLRPKVGRIYAASHAELLASVEQLQEPEWKVSVVNRPSETWHMVSASIESFLLQAAHHNRAYLPDFPAGRYTLEAWPDLGSLTGLVSALHIARATARAGHAGRARPNQASERR